MGVKVDYHQLTVIKSKLAKADARALPFVINAMEDATGDLGAEAKNNMGVESGALVESEWDGVTDLTPTSVTGKVTMQAPGKRQLPYAWIEEEGGFIVPRPENRRGVLAWFDKNDGTWHHAKIVYHKAKHYLTIALATKQREIISKLKFSFTGIFSKED